MGKAKFEERLERLRQLRSTAPNEESLLVLRKSLQDRANLVVAEAARVTTEFHLCSFIPDLLAAFDRLFADPLKADPKCWGKTAIAKALMQLDHFESAPFVRGARHVQMEPVWGGQEDAAVQLRATCVLGLVQCADLSRTEVFRQLVDAMTDGADPVRLEAVRALQQMDGEESRLLLRLKARLGDPRPLITGQVFEAILNLEGDQAVDFVAQYLRSDNDGVRDEAALALGGSRLTAAINVLIEMWNQTRTHDFGDVLLRALSLSRDSVAVEFLLNLIRTGPGRDAASALDALKVHVKSAEMQVLAEKAQKERAATS
jgi:hypothetical protein